MTLRKVKNETATADFQIVEYFSPLSPAASEGLTRSCAPEKRVVLQ